MPTMVTIRAAAEQTGLTYSCLRRWILEGKFIYYVRVGSKYLVNMEKLSDFLNSPAEVPDADDSRYGDTIHGKMCRTGRECS